MPKGKGKKVKVKPRISTPHLISTTAKFDHTSSISPSPSLALMSPLALGSSPNSNGATPTTISLRFTPQQQQQQLSLSPTPPSATVMQTGNRSISDRFRKFTGLKGNTSKLQHQQQDEDFVSNHRPYFPPSSPMVSSAVETSTSNGTVRGSPSGLRGGIPSSFLESAQNVTHQSPDSLGASYQPTSPKTPDFAQPFRFPLMSSPSAVDSSPGGGSSLPLSPVSHDTGILPPSPVSASSPPGDLPSGRSAKLEKKGAFKSKRGFLGLLRSNTRKKSDIHLSPSSATPLPPGVPAMPPPIPSPPVSPTLHASLSYPTPALQPSSHSGIPVPITRKHSLPIEHIPSDQRHPSRSQSVSANHSSTPSRSESISAFLSSAKELGLDPAEVSGLLSRSNSMHRSHSVSMSVDAAGGGGSGFRRGDFGSSSSLSGMVVEEGPGRLRKKSSSRSLAYAANVVKEDTEVVEGDSSPEMEQLATFSSIPGEEDQRADTTMHHHRPIRVPELTDTVTTNTNTASTSRTSIVRRTLILPKDSSQGSLHRQSLHRHSLRNSTSSIKPTPSSSRQQPLPSALSPTPPLPNSVSRTSFLASGSMGKRLVPLEGGSGEGRGHDRQDSTASFTSRYTNTNEEILQDGVGRDTRERSRHSGLDGEEVLKLVDGDDRERNDEEGQLGQHATNGSLFDLYHNLSSSTDDDDDDHNNEGLGHSLSRSRQQQQYNQHHNSIPSLHDTSSASPEAMQVRGETTPEEADVGSGGEAVEILEMSSEFPKVSLMKGSLA